MRDTIKADYGYSVRYCADGKHCKLYDGDRLVMSAELRTKEDYDDEVLNDGNEMAVKFEVFTTAKGNQFIYWGDLETDEDFLTKLEK